MKISKYASFLYSVLLVAGCGTVTQEKIDNSATEMRQRVEAHRHAQANREPLPLIEHLHGSFLGTNTVPLAYAASLPAIFRDNDVTLNFPARGASNGKVNLSTIAARITEVTRLPVRIRPDVFISAKSLVKSSASNASNSNDQSTTAKSTAPNGTPSMTPPPPLAAYNAGNAPVSTQLFADYDASLPMEYSGNLAGYLDFICARLGINWEYKDGGVTLYRFVTKAFPIKASPGTNVYNSKLVKGGGATSASTTQGATASGSFTTETNASVDSSFNVWNSMESAIKGMISSLGSVTVDQASGLVVVTDTKDVIETVSRYIDLVNSGLTRQVDLEVRVLHVQTTDSNQNALNLNIVYSKLNAGTAESAVSLSAPSTLASPAAGQVGFSVVSPTKPWGGSSVVVQALAELGTIVSDETRTVITTNRTPAPVGKFSTTTYLASTTPGTGGATGGAAQPGLNPGQVTTGSFLNVLPTAFENGSVLLRLSFDDTQLDSIGSISVGSGATLQTIQTPNISGSKSDHSVGLRDGESLVLLGTSTDRINGTNRNSITGLSATGSHLRDSQVIIVTPKVRAGI